MNNEQIEHTGKILIEYIKNSCKFYNDAEFICKVCGKSYFCRIDDKINTNQSFIIWLKRELIEDYPNHTDKEKAKARELMIQKIQSSFVENQTEITITSSVLRSVKDN